MSAVDRMADWPNLYRKRQEVVQRIAEDRDFLWEIEEALTIKTGHSASGISCSCGWHPQGGYPNDKERAVLAHVHKAWEDAE